MKTPVDNNKLEMITSFPMKEQRSFIRDIKAPPLEKPSC